MRKSISSKLYDQAVKLGKDFFELCIISLSINVLQIKLRATGGTKQRLQDRERSHALVSCILRALARSGIEIGRIEDVTPQQPLLLPSSKYSTR
ncbi:unnamed protein product [Cercopithifilaria johnstoni]|uniref:Ribosomal protein S14 n=1 Tax=Cercopithifilaria johnstoni TaxID=2874296 RepID=A0A8J2M489_9BILA|nr:unnamed protein product [Cercopithifilaria johnstoni]